MIKSGLDPVQPDRRDYSLLHTFGAVTPEPSGLPDDFSIYDGRTVPNQMDFDARFTPPLPPLPMGCTGESQTFSSGLQDGKLFNPKFTYERTPPGGNGGRGMRESLSCTIKVGLQDEQNTVGFNRTAYFNCYGSGKIDDFDASRIAIWINQSEKRSVSVGSYWYPEFDTPDQNGVLPIPSFKLQGASMHNWIVTGWKTINGKPHLECLSWQGSQYGKNGMAYVSRELFNALMGQPYTGAFTLTNIQGQGAVPVGIQAIIDNLVYYVRQLFNFGPKDAPKPSPDATEAPVEPVPAPKVETAREKLYEAALGFLGRDASPDDEAEDFYGCADSLSCVIRNVFPDFPHLVSTITLKQALDADKRFKQTLDFKPGNIIMSPSVWVGTKLVHGHCGVCGESDTIMSNSSSKGVWESNYTLQEWVKEMRQNRGLRVFFYEAV